MRRSRGRGLLGGAVLVCLGLVAGSTSGATFAAFDASTSNTGNTFSSKRIFPADRGTTGWSVLDAADGTASNESSLVAFTDARNYVTKLWTAGAFNTDRWMEFDLSSSLAAGLSFGNATFTLAYADDQGGGGEQACFYFEVRRASDASVISTHGSAGSPIDCETTSTIVSISTSIPAIDTTDEANDLRIRAYMMQDNNDNIRIDSATVTGTVYGKSMTLYPRIQRDRANGTTTTTAWGPDTSGDGSNYQTVGNWSSSFSTSRNLAITFPAYLPNAAVITGASISNAYRSATSGDTTCWYFATYAGSTLIGTHGSSSSPVSCNGTTSYVTNTVSVPEVDTATEANTLSLVIFARNTGGRRSQHDLIQLTVNYSLAATGCTDPGPVTVYATADSWVDQNAPNSTAGSTDVDIKVRSRSGSQNRRGLVAFDLPNIPTDCSVTGATLRLYQNASQGTRTIEVWRADSSWTEAGVTWNNQPATAGTAVTASNGSGWREWTVTTLVQELYIANHGFIVKDASEDSGTSLEQQYDTREATNDPELVVTFG